MDPSTRVVSLAVFSLALVACGDDTALGGGGAGGASGGAGGPGGSGGAAPAPVGCDGADLPDIPADTAQPGPWPVGAKTVDVGGLVTEVWYPATPGSDAGAAPKVYDLRAWLPAAEAAKISDAKTPTQTCACAADLPLDAAHGPYPVVLFVHGTAGFRTQSLELVQHWASRGFVVIAADHPGLYLADLITSLPMCPGEAPTQDLAADIATLVAGVEGQSGDLAFLAGHVDATRIGMVGHSAGGGAVGDQGDVAQVLVPMAAGGVSAGAKVTSALILGGKEDKVVPYSSQSSGYDSTPTATKRLVGLSPAGHLVFSSLCSIQNADGDDIVKVGSDANVCGLALAGALFDCDPSYLSAEEGTKIVNDAVSAALEETLHCAPQRADALATLDERYAGVVELKP